MKKGIASPKNRKPIPRIQATTQAGSAAPRSISSRVLKLCTAVVVLSVVWQIFVLGLYLDDWGFIATTAQSGHAFSMERWAAVRAMSLPRPGLTPVWFVLTSVLSDHVMLWHSALFALNCVVYFLLWRFAALLLNATALDSTAVVAYCCALFWFVLPWNAPFHFWPTDVPVLIVLILYLLSSWLLVRGWLDRRSRLLAPSLLYLWACLSYEALYFQWAPIGLIGLGLAFTGRADLKQVIKGVAALVLAQACAVLWFFVSLRLNVGTQNAIVPNWPQVLWTNLTILPHEILDSTKETARPFAAAAVLWLITAAYAHYRHRGAHKPAALWPTSYSSYPAWLALSCPSSHSVLEDALLPELELKLGRSYSLTCGASPRLF